MCGDDCVPRDVSERGATVQCVLSSRADVVADSRFPFLPYIVYRACVNLSRGGIHGGLETGVEKSGHTCDEPRGWNNTFRRVHLHVGSTTRSFSFSQRRARQPPLACRSFSTNHEGTTDRKKETRIPFPSYEKALEDKSQEATDARTNIDPIN